MGKRQSKKAIWRQTLFCLGLSFLATLFCFNSVAAELEHAIQVSWDGGTKVLTEQHDELHLVIEGFSITMKIHAVIEHNSEFGVFYDCQAEIVDDEVFTISSGHLDVISVTHSMPNHVDCGFGQVLELSLTAQ